MVDSKPDDIDRELVELHALYLRQLAENIAEIEMLNQQLGEAWDKKTSQKLIRHLHKLAGSGATFGLPAVGEYAREAELLLQEIAPLEDLDANQQGRMLELLESLREAASRTASNEAARAETGKDQFSKTNVIYMLEDDEIFGETLARQIKSYGFEVQLFTRIDALKTGLDRRIPDAMIVDVMLLEGDDAGIEFIKDIRRDYGLESLPVILFTVRTDFEVKLKARQARIDSFLSKPIDTNLLVTELDRLISETFNTEIIRILLIDDDEALSQRYKILLENAGMVAEILSDPTQACELIDDFKPDLIVMDVYMPECSGVDLAGIIRFHPNFVHIPIVFHSTERQIEHQLQALKTGGDDYLVKPISDNHFVEAIRTRALRAHRLNSQFIHDSLTGLVKHSVLKERLQMEFARKYRTGTHFCFLMLDLDDFKQVNDKHGHLVGDKVLHNLSRLLKSRVRIGDTVGRYGGEEFGVLLNDCSLEDGSKLIDKVREDFSRHQFRSDDGCFKTSFSAGISHSRDYSSAEEMLSAADKALYKAKSGGKNQLVANQHPE